VDHFLSDQYYPLVRKSKDIIALAVPVGFFVGIVIAMVAFLWPSFSLGILFPVLWLWALFAILLRGFSEGVGYDVFHLAAVLIANIGFYAALSMFLLSKQWKKAALFVGVNFVLSLFFFWAVPDLVIL
jgi:hypothetical protein